MRSGTGISNEAFAAGLAVFLIARARGADNGQALALSFLGGAITNASPELRQVIRQLPSALDQVGQLMLQVQRLRELNEEGRGRLLLAEDSDAERFRRAILAAQRVLEDTSEA
jgi:UDP-N-acetylglucosamine:LPS N-acetylglucosamine transferase